MEMDWLYAYAIANVFVDQHLHFAILWFALVEWERREIMNTLQGGGRLSPNVIFRHGGGEGVRRRYVTL